MNSDYTNIFSNKNARINAISVHLGIKYIFPHLHFNTLLMSIAHPLIGYSIKSTFETFMTLLTWSVTSHKFNPL